MAPFFVAFCCLPSSKMAIFEDMEPVLVPASLFSAFFEDGRGLSIFGKSFVVKGVYVIGVRAVKRPIPEKM